jgi:hypothetical protein
MMFHEKVRRNTRKMPGIWKIAKYVRLAEINPVQKNRSVFQGPSRLSAQLWQ